MYKATEWKNHIVQYRHRYLMTKGEADGLVYLTPSPGEIEQQGTPQNAENFNHIEKGIFEDSKILDEHVKNKNIHITEEEREKWNEEMGEKGITFSQATNRENLTSGEKLKISLGKIKKWLADLKTVAFTGSYSDLSNKPTIPAAVRVKGNAESTYRTGDVNVTPENIGALPASGGTLTGDLRIKGSGNYGTKINLGDGDYVHFSEPTDDCLEVKAKKINFLVSDTTDEKFTLNGEKIGAKADEATKATKDAEGNVITDSYAVRKTITNGDFNDITTPGLYTMRQTSGNSPRSEIFYYSLLVLKSDNENYVEQLAFQESSCAMYIRCLRGSNGWSSWEKINDGGAAATAVKATQDGNGNVIANTYLTKTGDSANNTITFSSPDESSPASWVNIPVLVSGEKHYTIFNKIANMCKNVRYLYKMLGTTSISSIGNGTVTGAINTLNTNLSTWETLTISETYSGFKYTGGLMKYHPILKLAFISVTIQATVATTTGVKIDMCKFNKVPSVNTALSARSPNTAGQAVNVAIFTDGTLSLSTDKAIPKDGYILCSGIYSFT